MGEATVKDCVFTNNYATTSGGAVYLVNGSQNIMENCQVTNNEAGDMGGGIACRGNLDLINSLGVKHDDEPDQE